MFSDDALNSESMQKMDVRDRHLTTEIVYGCLRWRALLDNTLEEASSRPWREVEPGIRILLRMSLYQMWRMDRIPDHAIVNDAVELAKLSMQQGAGRYVNGVLRQLARIRPWKRDPQGHELPLWIQVSLPRWLWKRWASRYGTDPARDYALSLNEPAQTAVRWLSGENARDLPFQVFPSDIVPGAYLRGRDSKKRTRDEYALFQFQDEASQLIPHLLGDIDGWIVWDVCAAPGGKCLILADKCGVSGRVIASDLRPERLGRLVNLLKHANKNNVDVLVADACTTPPFGVRFDAVVVDAPCSGLGTLRRNPEIKWHFHPRRFGSLSNIQRSILHSASNAVRAGGYLLYSTCSTEPEENEHVLESFLNAHPEFRLERPAHPQGIACWTGADNMVRTFPSTRLWDGLFAALMKRRR